MSANTELKQLISDALRVPPDHMLTAVAIPYPLWQLAKMEVPEHFELSFMGVPIVASQSLGFGEITFTFRATSPCPTCGRK